MADFMGMMKQAAQLQTKLQEMQAQARTERVGTLPSPQCNCTSLILVRRSSLVKTPTCEPTRTSRLPRLPTLRQSTEFASFLTAASQRWSMLILPRQARIQQAGLDDERDLDE